jgi:predicted GNAT family acetyltransferase
MGIEIRKDDQGERGRYHLLVDGADVGEVDYRVVDGRRAFTHTGVREAYEGQGLAGRLAERVLDDARADGVGIVPLCPYIRGYIERHDAYADLVDHDAWDRARSR